MVAFLRSQGVSRPMPGRSGIDAVHMILFESAFS
jgi:hypothetical protein